VLCGYRERLGFGGIKKPYHSTRILFEGVGTSTIGQHSFGWNESMSAAALAVGKALAAIFLILSDEK